MNILQHFQHRTDFRRRTNHAHPLVALVATAITVSSCCLQAGGWVDTSPLPQEGDFRSAALGTEALVLAGLGGKIWTQDADGDWTAADTPTRENLTSVVYANERFVAVGEAGSLMHSVDGLAWHQVNAGTAADLYRVQSVGGRWFALGSGGVILSSGNGVTWDAASLGAGIRLNDVAGIEGNWVSVGDQGVIYRSVDGSAWTRENSGTSQKLIAVTRGVDRFVAITGQTIVTLIDGAARWVVLSGQNGLRDVTFGNGQFVVVGGTCWVDGGFPVPWAHVVLSSDDGLTWTDRIDPMEPPWFPAPLNSVVYGDEGFVAAAAFEACGSPPYVEGGRPGFFVSPDGLTWTAHEGPFVEELVVGEGGYLGFASSPETRVVRITSNDGGFQAEGVALAFLDDLYDIYFAGDRFVAVGGRCSLTSPDGDSWTVYQADDWVAPSGVVHGNGRFVGFSPQRALIHSTDGLRWEQAKGEVSANYAHLDFAKDRFVAVGTGGAVAVSFDGVDWTRQDSGTTHDLQDWARGRELIVAVGKGGTLLVSPDGLSWEVLTSGVTADLFHIEYGNGTFVVLGKGTDFYSSLVLRSSDGRNWQTGAANIRAAGTNASLLFRDDCFMAVLLADWPDNHIVFSADGLDWTLREPMWVGPTQLGRIAAGQNTVAVLTQAGHDWDFHQTPLPGRVHMGGDFATALQCSAGVDLHCVAYGRGVYLVVGDYGTILRSPRLRPALAGRQLLRPPNASAYELRVDAVEELSYSIEWSSDLRTWTSLGDFTSSGDAQVLEYPLPPESAQRFYRSVESKEPQVEPFDNMIWIEPGTFTMGSPSSEPERLDNEGPQTQVTLSRGFWLGKYEVTQREYKAVIGTNPSYFTGASDHPVEMVSWNEAVAYCEALTLQQEAAGRLPAGYAYKLPTEAQWEYACRAGTTTPFSIGNGTSLSSTQANFWGDMPYGGGAQGPYLRRTAKVGSYAPNAWGLYDMHGNVWEWCADLEGGYPGGSVTDPAGPTTGNSRRIRGGEWSWTAGYCRSASRGWRGPWETRATDGFRVALVPVS